MAGSLMRHRESIAMQITAQKQRLIDDHRPRRCINIICLIQLRIVDRQTVGFLENGHPQIDAPMRQILKILLQPHIKLRKCLNINFLRHFQSLRGEVSYKQFSNIVQIIFT